MFRERRPRAEGQLTHRVFDNQSQRQESSRSATGGVQSNICRFHTMSIDRVVVFGREERKEGSTANPSIIMKTVTPGLHRRFMKRQELMSVRCNPFVKAPAEMRNNFRMSKSLVLQMPQYLIKNQTKSDGWSQGGRLQEASQVPLPSGGPGGRVMDIPNNKPQCLAHWVCHLNRKCYKTQAIK